jgi:glycosyltransferase involved in cell wall biosynthesis
MSASKIPVIAPVPAGEPRPRWSVMIPTFNCAALAVDAIESVVKQACSPDQMEIVVVDDASTDDIASAVAQFAPRVRVHRQPSNRGVPANLTECIRLSRGECVHVLHGDDQVLPGFYAAMEGALADASVGAAFCRQIFMNGSGAWLDVSPLEQPDGLISRPATFLAEEQRIMTPSMCVRRSVYERIGGFHPELACAEDWEMWVRIAARFPVAYVSAPLALYRMHEESNTGRHLRRAAEVPYILRAISLIAEHVPPEESARVANHARTTYARSTLSTADRLARSGDREGALANVRGALKLNASPATLARAFVSLSRIAWYAATGAAAA